MSNSHISNQSLQWTRPLLDELFEDVRQAVERFGDEDRERQSGDLDQAVEACEKVAGSLAVMEFDSGKLIAEAMGLALEALKGGEARDEGETIARILEATAILPDYLDYLESTQTDTPVVVLPTINDLRASAGKPALDEAMFFRPEVDGVTLPEASNEAELAELRRDYQHALRGFLVNNQDSEAVQALADVSLKIRDAGQAPVAVRRVGWAAAALCEALKEQHVAGGPNLTRLFARTDVTLKEFAEQDESEELAKKADDLCRGFLFQIALSQAKTPLAQEVQEAFDLAEHTPDQLAQAKVFLAGRNRALFSAVTKAAREDLAKIKEALGTQLERDSDPEVLNQQTALLESVGESLSMLGLDHLSTRVKAQASKLEDLGNNPEDPALLMVARELLVVESQLEESFGLAADLDDDEEMGEADATLLPPSEQRRVVKQMVKEALEDLAHAKHLLDAINRRKADDNAIEESTVILERISGALRMASLDEAAQMLDAASRVAVDHLSPDVEESDPAALEALAETLTVTEFYLESLTTQDERGHRYLHSARERLTALGYLESDSDALADTLEIDTTPDSRAEVEVEDDFELEENAEASDNLLDLEDDSEAVEIELDDSEFDHREFDDGEPVEIDETEEIEVEDTVFDKEDDDELSIAEAEAPASPPAEPPPSAFDDFDIVEIFLEEFDQEYESLSDIVPQWQDQPADEEHTVTIRRAFHSLKGSGRMAGAMEIGEFAWAVESMLNRVLDGQLMPEPRVTSIVADAVGALPSMRARLAGEGEQTHDEAACAAIGKRAEMAAEGRLDEVAEGEAVEVEQIAVGALPPELEGLDSTLVELMVK
ncbi:MAG: Hpt domain-containing protein, partial [Pseudomonadota bacterium]